MEHNYIGISEDRLHHILGVARKAYTIALERGHNEEYAKKMFMLGWLHDVGYEFVEDKEQHSRESVSLIKTIFPGPNDMFPKESNIALDAISKHGCYTILQNEDWIILNQADLLVGPDGKDVSITERLKDIKERYGEYSNDYLTACDIAYSVGLTAINIAANIT